ncbi:tetratricopeptide repeat protein [Streptomyces sp. NPDC059897]|uniref:tetratricopeptide repeat protein n=1 Tax=Streptomyces sp. NPDC059897 TaxID=3346994 RepID=UPI00366506AB
MVRRRTRRDNVLYPAHPGTDPAHSSKAAPVSDDGYYDLGSFHREITTSAPEAQLWFDRGLLWVYGFRHEEAAHCFEQAVAADEQCAMAHWGLAYALGPNYNKPWEAFDERDLTSSVERTHHAVQRAALAAARATPVEQALIDALTSRYPSAGPAPDQSVWNEEYAQAMGKVYANHQDDPDVAALYADALMNLTPWQLWDLPTGRPADGARTVEAREALERALARPQGRDHPGLLHLYIHLMEMSPTPEQALPVADRLRGLVPDAGHLHHMPSHIDVLCGDYRRTIAANTRAVEADEKALARDGAMNFYTLYRCHNLHFRLYAAMFAGQAEVAFDSVDRLEAAVPEELLHLQSPPMADWLEGFLGMRVHALIRFGRWQDLIDLPLPGDPELYRVTTAMTHYGRGVALAATGRTREAATERARFTAAVERVPETRTIYNNTCLDLLAVAAAMLDGELAYRTGDFDEAFTHLRRAIELDDALPYDEPWGWMQPTRHAYGALLLEQGRVAEAADVYAADLGLNDTLPRSLRHPHNVWALHGLHECLLRLGRTAEARIIAPELTTALAVADVPIRSSCYCRLETADSSDDCCSDHPPTP